MHSLFSVALEEAINDGGVLVVHQALVQQHLRDKCLMRPFEPVVELPQNLVAKMTPIFQQSKTFKQMKKVLFDG